MVTKSVDEQALPWGKGWDGVGNGCRQALKKHRQRDAFLVPRAGIEPARPFRAKGFSYHYGFRHRSGFWPVFVVWTIPSPWGGAL